MKKSLLRVIGIMVVPCLLALASCGGGGGGSDDENVVPDGTVPEIDLSGGWAGSWTGHDPLEGEVYGFWEAQVQQNETAVSGSIVLSGDADCPEGAITGAVDESELISGTLDRSPCQLNNWILSAVNVGDLTASGSWTQPGSGATGSFTGVQISNPGGPRISFVYPPGGKEGAFVHVVGERFAPVAADNRLLFNEVQGPVLTVKDGDTILATVPRNSTNGPVTLETVSGIAISPRSFISNVTSPTRFISGEISLGRSQTAIAFNPNGVRLYYTANHQVSSLGGLMMLDAVTLETVRVSPVSTTADVTLQGLAVSPDGRYVYAACDEFGLCVYDAVNIALLATIPVESGRPDKFSPQGINLTPDGQLLFVSNNQDGGGVSMVDTETYSVLSNISLGSGYAPQGIAVHPSGRFAYIAFSAPLNQNGRLLVYDIETMQAITSIEVGIGPIGVAVTPNGEKLYVSNELENSIDVIDTVSHQIFLTIPVKAGPTGVAISPDGETVYIACRLANIIDIVSVDLDQVIASISVYPEPLHVGFSPDGKRAYVTHANFGLSEEIGGQLTLSIAKAGSGIGTVNSSPGTIECGTSCQENFDSNTVVSLTPIPDSGSYFARWDGHQDCLDGVVTMDSDKYCVAVFNVSSSSSSGGTQVYGSTSCFIATAAYGSYLDPHVETLRNFRDNYLLKNPIGRKFVHLYYDISPPIASYISKHEGLRKTTRVVLTPIVAGIRYPQVSVLALLVLLLGLILRIRMKKKL